MDDLISRQAAIDAFEMFGEYESNRTNKDWVRLIKVVLSDLPPAQPEIIRCKDCKHRDMENGFCEGRGWPMQLVPDDGFCDKGKRSEE